MKYLPYIFLICIVLTDSCTASMQRLAEQRNIIFDRLGTEEGLSQGLVTTFAQDERGFIWIGTQEGLNRFDGFEFTSFYHLDGNPSTLSHDSIWALLFDSQRRFWIGTDAGLNIYDGLNQTFSLVPLGFRKENYEPEVYAILEDPRGALWVGTSVGLARLENTGNDLAVENFELTDEGGVRALALSPDGNLYIGTERSGVFFLNVFKRELIYPLRYDSKGEPITTDGHVRDLIIDDTGHLWIATFSGGLSKVSLESKVVERFSSDPNDKAGLASNRVRSLFQDSSGDVWVGTDNGLHLWATGTQKFLKYQLDLTDPRSISDNVVLDIFQDDGGVVWVGTFNGVSKWNAIVNLFPYFKRTAGPGGRVPGDNVTSFVEDPVGNVWIGTFNGLMVWDAVQGELFSLHEEELQLSDRRVMSLGVVGDEVWIGTMAGGINVPSGSETKVLRNTGSADSLSSNAITKIYTDSKERTWITTYGGGLNLYLGEDRFRRYPLSESSEYRFTDLRCMDVIEASDGMLWIATDGGGVVILDPTTGRTRSIEHKSTVENSLSSNNLLNVLETEQGMWIGSLDRGVTLYDMETEDFVRYSKRNGLASDSVYGMLVDSSGVLWISGGKGLTRFDPVAEEFTRFDASHGLQSSDFNSGAYAKLGDGSLLFGGNNGFNAFYPTDIELNKHVPEIKLTSFSISNEEILSGRNLDMIEQIELSHSDSVVGFSFAALDYTAPEKNRYRYKLEGFDKDWVDHGGNREVTYTNLDAGLYTFRVQGSNNDGVWNEEGTSIEVLVHPAPWLTWWAYCIYLAIAVLGFYLLLRMNSDRLRREAERRYSERLQLYIESLEEASDCILIADSEGTLLYANNTITEGLSKSPSEVIGKSLFSVLFQDDQDVEDARRSLEDDGRFYGEVELTDETGKSVFHDVTIAAVQQSSSGSAYVGISRDVTDRKQTEAELDDYRRNLERLVSERTERLQKEIAENKAIQVHLANSLQEKELLIKEVHHRVKNNMQVISSLLSIQAEGTGDTTYSTLLNESQQRIKSMALIHETLYQSEDLLKIDFQEYIESLTNSLSRSYVVPGVSVFVDVNVEDVQLDLETAVPCGLIINELASNALKHAFVGKEGPGVIDIDFVIQDCNYSLRIADNGIGLSDEFDLDRHTSMGMEIVAILTAQLEGKLKACNDEGAVFEITFPRRAHA